MRKFVLFLSVALGLYAAATTDEGVAEKIRRQNMEVVKAAAESLSKELPKKVDDYTKLVAIEGKGERLIYSFEVDAGPKSDEELIREGKARMTRNVTRGVCASSQRFLKSGITIVYRYLSAHTKKRLFDVVVTEKECPFLAE